MCTTLEEIFLVLVSGDPRVISHAIQNLEEMCLGASNLIINKFTSYCLSSTTC